MEPQAPELSKELLAEIRRGADVLDQSGQWPLEELERLARAGAMRWAVPREFGGLELSTLDQHLAYERLARASLAVALVLSQRDSAVGLVDAAQSEIRREMLPRLASDEVFSTVGIAQLTTSRQGGPPAVRAVRTPDGYQLDGLIPWCTGAAKAQFIVAGANTEDGKQILVLLPTDAPGVRIDDPMPLAALTASWTTSVHCEGVKIDERFVLRGPAEKVIVRPNHLPLGQAFLAMGFCRGVLDLIAEHWSAAAEKAFKRLEAELVQIREQVIRLSGAGMEADANAAAPMIRGQCNDLALRSAHAAVTLYKGTALLVTHPAQRLAREALFLLVWSCPNPVIDCTVDLLTHESS
jgi:alkylation response protein AidB-like acyl-CoA dehydrogenase